MDESANDKREKDGKTYSSEKARQGEVILRTRAQKAIFFGGLIAAVVLAFIMSILVR